MAKCGVCGKNRGTRTISGVPFCEECFYDLQKMRNCDEEKIEYYLNPDNYVDATEAARNYMMERAKDMLKKVKEKKDNYDQRKMEESEPYENVILTTTNSLEENRITKYLGLVYGEVVIPNGLLGVITSGTFFTINSMEKARANAIQIIKKNAYNMGANAVVGVDIDINDLNGNGVMVSVNGTAVLVEKQVNTSNIE